jgi:ribosomal protein S18 acetylase RimI-like enzyme
MGDWQMFPMTEAPSEIMEEMKSWLFIAAVANGKLVGAVRGKMYDRKCVLSRLFVHPQLRRKGFGSELLRAIEARFPDADTFEVFIGRKQSSVVDFLERNGYALSREFILSNNVTYAFMSKLPSLGR